MGLVGRVPAAAGIPVHRREFCVRASRAASPRYRTHDPRRAGAARAAPRIPLDHRRRGFGAERLVGVAPARGFCRRDRKSTRLNSSHEWISYAVFCLKKKKIIMMAEH